LTPNQVKDIKKELKTGRSNTEIAKLYKVNQSTISNIKTGKTWWRF
jgi:DNA-binding CsgD family transcriptional regulator